jgi:mannan polymerase II complex MNN10 subunit
MKHIFTLLALLAMTPLSAVNIDVATMAIGEWYQQVTYPSYINKAAYCQRHGYPFHYYIESLDTSRPIPWSKIKIIQELFEDPKVEWVFWTDADSLVMNSRLKLKYLLDDRFDMITASDNNNINTGQFFIRNCAWSKDFLARIYSKEQFINHEWWEQMSIMDEYANNAKDRKHIKILKQRAMNSYAQEVYSDDRGYYRTGDFIIHFAGQRGQTLIDLMNKYSAMAK